jgi:DNA processing protein
MREATSEERARLWLNCAVEYNVRLFNRIAARFTSLADAKQAYEAGDAVFSKLTERVTTRLSEAAKPGYIERFIEKLEKNQIEFTYPGEQNYPALLAELSDAPSVLYYKGMLEPEAEVSIAVVGSRRPTAYGTDTAKRFAFSLAEAGALIVSGMAEGIDAAAARGALESTTNRCRTVAVLGCGVDVIYPQSNAKLYREIIEHGAVVSEFLPGSHANRFHFPIRNRVMSGLAHGTLVVEAAQRSGTSITAGWAHDQGRDVFAVPGRIGDAMSAGPNGMIARGEAKAVLSPEDILAEYSCLHVPAQTYPDAEIVSLSTLPEAQRKVCRLLRRGELSFDELCDALDMPIGPLNACLTELQFSGVILCLPGRLYAIDTERVVVKEG